MSRLIDADALLEVYASKLKLLAVTYGCRSEYGILSGAMELVRRQPTIEARKTGTWKKMTADSTYWYECSECGVRPLRNWWHGQDELSNFCPNCGADMRSGKEKANEN